MCRKILQYLFIIVGMAMSTRPGEAILSMQGGFLDRDITSQSVWTAPREFPRVTADELTIGELDRVYQKIDTLRQFRLPGANFMVRNLPSPTSLEGSFLINLEPIYVRWVGIPDYLLNIALNNDPKLYSLLEALRTRFLALQDGSSPGKIVVEGDLWKLSAEREKAKTKELTFTFTFTLQSEIEPSQKYVWEVREYALVSTEDPILAGDPHIAEVVQTYGHGYVVYREIAITTPDGKNENFLQAYITFRSDQLNDFQVFYETFHLILDDEHNISDQKIISDYQTRFIKTPDGGTVFLLTDTVNKSQLVGMLTNSGYIVNIGEKMAYEVKYNPDSSIGIVFSDGTKGVISSFFTPYTATGFTSSNNGYKVNWENPADKTSLEEVVNNISVEYGITDGDNQSFVGYKKSAWRFVYDKGTLKEAIFDKENTMYDINTTQILWADVNSGVDIKQPKFKYGLIRKYKRIELGEKTDIASRSIIIGGRKIEYRYFRRYPANFYDVLEANFYEVTSTPRNYVEESLPLWEKLPPREGEPAPVSNWGTKLWAYTKLYPNAELVHGALTEHGWIVDRYQMNLASLTPLTDAFLTAYDKTFDTQLFGTFKLKEKTAIDIMSKIREGREAHRVLKLKEFVPYFPYGPDTEVPRWTMIRLAWSSYIMNVLIPELDVQHIPYSWDQEKMMFIIYPEPTTPPAK